jgi:hypothetical protein
MGPYLVQLANGRYRVALTLPAAMAMARQVAKSSGRPSAIREASLSPGSTIMYAEANGQMRRAS